MLENGSILFRAANLVGLAIAAGFLISALRSSLARNQTRYWPRWSTGKLGVPISRLSLAFRAVFAVGLVLIFIPVSDPWVRFVGTLIALFGAVGGTVSFARDVFGTFPKA